MLSPDSTVFSSMRDKFLAFNSWAIDLGSWLSAKLLKRRNMISFFDSSSMQSRLNLLFFRKITSEHCLFLKSMKPLRFWVWLFGKLLEPIRWNSIHYLLVVNCHYRSWEILIRVYFESRYHSASPFLEWYSSYLCELLNARVFRRLRICTVPVSELRCRYSAVRVSKV